MSRRIESKNAIPTRGRITQLDGLRAVAILAVYLDHTVYNHLLWTGVDIFFVLSGFLITSILLERKSGRQSYFSYFYVRRVFRILPPYAICILLAIPAFGAGFLHFWPYFAFFAMNFFAVMHPILPLPLWSLAVEEQFYFIWPVVVRWMSERILLRLALVAVVITPVMRGVAAAHGHANLIYFLTPFRADLLCAGGAVAILARRVPARVEKVGRKFGLWGTLAGYGLFVGSQAIPAFRVSAGRWEGAGLTLTFSLLGAVSLLVWSLANRGWLFRFLTLRPLRFLGQISYTFYLTHMSFIELAWRWHWPFHVLSVFVATVAFSSASWFLMERPLIACAARLAPGGPPVPTAV